jgi:hypothetical protein
MSQTFNGDNGMISGLVNQMPVYGPNGEMFPSADAARASGVFNFTYAPSAYGYQAPMAPQSRMYDPAAADYTSQSFAMPAARGSFNPLALRGSGLLSVTGSAVLPNNVPMYENTWKVPDYLAPARVQAMQADGGGGGGFDGMGVGSGADLGSLSSEAVAAALADAGYSDTGGYSEAPADGGYDGGDIGGLW